jgi:hypothetical protein
VKRNTWAILVTAAVFILLALYFNQNPSTPSGQEPLTTLSSANFVAFASAFDQSPGGPRLLLLLSPT